MFSAALRRQMGEVCIAVFDVKFCCQLEIVWFVNNYYLASKY